MFLKVTFTNKTFGIDKKEIEVELDDERLEGLGGQDLYDKIDELLEDFVCEYFEWRFDEEDIWSTKTMTDEELQCWMWREKYVLDTMEDDPEAEKGYKIAILRAIEVVDTLSKVLGYSGCPRCGYKMLPADGGWHCSECDFEAEDIKKRRGAK